MDWLIKLFYRLHNRYYYHELFLLDCQIHGSHYYECLPLLQNNAVSVGEEVILHREPNNIHDNFAIEVLTTHHQKLGYVPQKHNRVIAALMDQCCDISAEISEIFTTAWEPITIRIKMRICCANNQD